MRLSLHILLFVATAVVSITAFRLRRDVSHLETAPSEDYLPPAAELEAADEPVASEENNQVPVAVEEEGEPQDSAVLGDSGYEYKQAQNSRLRYRKRRDVSHLQLNREYLPPAEPSREYLPPPVHEALPLEDEPEQPEPKVSNEYLPPPVAEEEVKSEPLVETEAPTAVETEAPEVVTEAATEPTVAEAEAPQDTAVLKDDGYHYKKPNAVPDALLYAVPEVSSEYLPPLEKGAVEAEGPGEESAALEDDGYHYRVVRRLRF